MWGDGSEEYTAWWARHVVKHPDFETDIGGMYAWAYVEGFLCQIEPNYDRGCDLTHIALYGLGELHKQQFPISFYFVDEL